MRINLPVELRITRLDRRRRTLYKRIVRSGAARRGERGPR